MRNKRFLLDSCNVYRDLDLSTVDTALTAEKLKAATLGITKGGTPFEAIPDIREIEFNGKLDRKVKGMERIVGWAVKVECELMEYVGKNLEAALMTKKTNASTKYDQYTGQADIELANYKNVVLVGRVWDSQEPIIIEILNSYNGSGITITGEDKNEGSIKMSFEGHYDLDKPNEAPFNIYFPKETPGKTILEKYELPDSVEKL